MFLDDAITDAQAEAGAFADFFGGEEGIEDAVGVGDAVAVIAERDFHETVAAARGNLNAGAGHGFAHGVVSVVQDIEEDLLQLLRVADHERQSCRHSSQ